MWLDGAKCSAKAEGEAISQLEAWEIPLCLYVFVMIGHNGVTLSLYQFIMIHQYSDFGSVHCTGSIPRAGPFFHGASQLEATEFDCLWCGGPAISWTNPHGIVWLARPSTIVAIGRLMNVGVMMFGRSCPLGKETLRILLWKWCSLPTDNLQTSVTCKADSLEHRFTTHTSDIFWLKRGKLLLQRESTPSCRCQPNFFLSWDTQGEPRSGWEILNPDNVKMNVTGA